jgi:uncharacterized lipoprotein YajG
MAFTVQFDQSNRADWIIDISATDADTSADIVFTGATVSFVVKDENNCQKLSATIGSGITQLSTTVLEVTFTAAQMETLCAGTYKIGCVYGINGNITQLLTGSVSIYDGIAQL